MFAGEALCLIPFLARRWYKAATGAGAERSEEDKAAAGQRLRRTFWVFALPALCDAGATTLLNLGLYYTYASVFQMLRGTLVIFAGTHAPLAFTLQCAASPRARTNAPRRLWLAGLLTIVLLKRRLHRHNWMGIVLITAGAALVGASSILDSTKGGGARQPAAVAGNARRLAWLDGGAGMGAPAAPSSASNPLLGDTLVVLAQMLAATQ